MRFAVRLKALREEAGLTQAELAARAGLHPMGYGKLEQGLRQPAWGSVLAIAEALGVSLDAFRPAPGDAPAKGAEPVTEGPPARRSGRKRSK